MKLTCCNHNKWHHHFLGDVFDLNYGYSLPKQIRSEGTVPVFGSNGCVGYHSEGITHGPTIILGRKGSAGEVVWSNVPCFPIDTAYYIESLKIPSSLKYIFFGLKSLNLRSLDKSSAVPGLDREEVYKLKLWFPPTVEAQNEIVNEIEQKFNQFEQMRIAAEQQAEATSALSIAVLRNVFSIQKLPPGWTRRAIGDLVHIDGTQIDSRHPDFTTLPFLGLENIESGTGCYVTSDESIETGRSACFRFDSRHVLYGKLRPYLNKVFLPNSDGRCALEILPFLPKGNFSREFVAAVLMSPSIVAYMIQHSTGGRMPRADIRKLMRFQVAMPETEDACNQLGVQLMKRLQICQTVRSSVSRGLEALLVLPSATLREFFNFGNDVHV